MRVGLGFDVHQLEEGQDFYLGGLKIDHFKGAIGHSDADVLIHAICDALLGAANLGDIGFHFPNTDPSLKGVDSKYLLRKVIRLIANKGYKVVNIDSTICLQSPKIGKYVPEMKKILAEYAGMDIDDISIKATTTETLGYIGREEGVSAYAVVLIDKKQTT